MYSFHQGILKLKNPKKYAGDPENVVYRSSWECAVYKWLDNEPNVITWGAEELHVPYLSPVDQKIHRYFPDVIAKVKTPTGLSIFMIEIKPFGQTQPPAPQKRKTKRYLKEIATYAVNQAKWEQASKFCKERGWTFRVITERDIFGSQNK